MTVAFLSGGVYAGDLHQMDTATRADMGGYGVDADTGASMNASGALSRDWSDSEYKIHQIKSVQSALKTKGFNPGAIDGQIGPQTTQAIKDFQFRYGLTDTGRLNQQTIEKLGVEFSDNPNAQQGDLYSE